MNEQQGYEAAILEMTITPYMENQLKEVFLIEMLQAGREELPDGRIFYRIGIFDPTKADAVMQAMLKMMYHGTPVTLS